MLVLDTDHFSLIRDPTRECVALLSRLRASGDEVVTTIVSVEENLRGWLAQISRQVDTRKQVFAYQKLKTRVEFFADWVLLGWDIEAAFQFADFRQKRIRIGTQDLKIACITLAHDATLLTRNLTDFRMVPGLRVEDWLD